MTRPLYVYVDVDETFVRSYGTKRIPMPPVIAHIRELKEQGAELYCWSSGGAEYARQSAEEFGIAECFNAFLPKPEVAIDDLEFSQWSGLLQVHPNECPGNSVVSYRAKIAKNPTAT